jgi:hypothetical protein
MDRYYQETLSVPSGTASAAPVTTAVVLENATLVDVEIIVPPGHQGLTGIRVRMSGQQVLPWANDSWIVADDYRRVFDVDTQIGARAVSLQGYNTDVFPHTFYVRFHIRSVGVVGTLPSDTLPGGIGDIGSGQPPPDTALPPIELPPAIPGLPPLPPLPIPPPFVLPGGEMGGMANARTWRLLMW